MRGLRLKIRNFVEHDLETLYEIDRVCFADDIAFSRAELLSQINRSRSITRVGERAGRILGFVIAHIVHPTHAHILTLDVIPDVRRRGIGLALMNSLHGTLAKHGIGITVLEVSVRNHPALKLYEKMGYRRTDTLNGYYRGREDAFRMIRSSGA